MIEGNKKVSDRIRKYCGNKGRKPTLRGNNKHVGQDSVRDRLTSPSQKQKTI